MAASNAQVQKSPPGTYYSAKDPDLVPLPFNRYPELPVVEIEPGIFLVDDTSIPDTPEQIAGRQRRQEAAEYARQLAANPALAQAAREAQQTAREAEWKKNREQVATWLVLPLPTSEGAPARRESIESETRSKLLTLSVQF